MSASNQNACRFDCKWTALGSGSANVVHFYFGNSCLAMPHLAHMCFAVFITIVFCSACFALVSTESGFRTGSAGLGLGH